MKLTLIDNWKQCWKLATFQISMLLILLETSNAWIGYLPAEYADVIRNLLIVAIPLARNFKLRVKDYDDNAK